MPAEIQPEQEQNAQPTPIVTNNEQIDSSRTRLITQVAIPPQSFVDSSTFVVSDASSSVSLGGSLTRITPRGQLLGPVPASAQEQLLFKWLSTYLNIELDPGRPLAEALDSGELLCLLVHARRIPDPDQEFYAPAVFAKRLETFHIRARAFVKSYDMFHNDDLLLRRDLPRVFRSVAELAKALDPVGFSEIAAQVPGSRVSWTARDEPGEVLTVGSPAHCLTESVSEMHLLVLGDPRSGKSSLANALLGRPSIQLSPGLCYIPSSDMEFSAKGREDVARRRRLLTETEMPEDPILVYGAPGPTEGVSRGVLYGKGGKHITITEVAPEEVVPKEKFHAIILVSRLDIEEPNDGLLKAAKQAREVFGKGIASRIVVALTHSSALTPRGEDREAWIRRRTRDVMASVWRGAGVNVRNENVAVPIVLTEEGSQDSINALATKIVEISNSHSQTLKPKRETPWWESVLIGAVLSAVLSKTG